MSVSTISDSTKEITHVAYPRQQTSTELQGITLAMSKFGLSGYYSNDLDTLNKIKANLMQENESFEFYLNKLKQLEVDGHKNISDLASLYQQQINNVFNQRAASIEAEKQLKSQSFEIEDAADTAYSQLIDLADIGVNNEASSIIKSAETNLDVVINYLYDVENLKSMTMFSTYNSAVDIYLKNLQQSANQLNQNLSENESAVDYIEEFSDATDSIITSFKGQSGLLNAAKNKLNQEELAKQSLVKADEYLINLTESLKALSKASEAFVSNAEKEVQQSISTVNYKTYVVIAISLFVAFIIAFAVLRSITRPLEQINSALAKIAIGDLSTRLDDSSQDELGQLAKSCNQVVEGLRNVINEIASSSTQTASAAEEMSNITSVSASEIQRQKIEVDQIASATMQMSSASELVAKSAQESSEQIQIVTSEAENVRNISDYNAETIEKLAQKIESASAVIDKLSNHTDAIGGILDVIRSIAEQTNLLALNAAIEAARAGEHGRGFAVVADEVRTLASRTQESTSEIQNMIENLQTGTQQAVGVMQSSREQAVEVVDLAKQSSAALLNIANAINTANQKSYEISHSANEQSTVSEEINQKLMSIVEITERNAQAAQQTSESSQEVANLSAQLLSSTRKFKI
ncbi:methyl-accepting chemotaxis protein [Catenovulum sp. 2E275]|uniref:methyl-accepting chemotaxis protein n=1 Tax=Catenovulum sp. 2E275 TaxID=2980497 RepID=UPI0021D29FEE|nr:methyl-accepting chemotaxis protein [Catenovulum sp. 2E275]MCU4674582.1 methyl-accepting chemotaxis protein [Catenovulum sp. 2E275]